MTQGKAISVITLDELFSESTSGFLPILADIQHDGIVWGDGSTDQEDGHLRLINDKTAVKYNGHTYMPAYFDFTQPQEDGKKVGSTNITISAIDQRVQQIIRSINDSRPILVIETFFCKTEGYRLLKHGESANEYYKKDEYGQFKLVDPDGDLNNRLYKKVDSYIFSKLNHYEFEMSQASWDNMTAKWSLTFDPAMQVNVPIDSATELRCPAINTGK